MRKITVDIIANENFDTAPNGYDQKQVDDFLNEICDYLEFGIGESTPNASNDAELQKLRLEKQELENRLNATNFNQSSQVEIDRKNIEITKLNAEISRLQALVKTAQRESAEARAKLEMTPKSEIELSSERSTQLLVSAQKLYDSTVEQANKEAKDILAKAQQEADTQIGSLKSEKANLEQALASLKTSFTEYLDKLDNIIKNQKSELDESRARLK